MKDILSKKRKFGDYETIALTESCTIREHQFGKASYDLGISINLMPLRFFKNFGLVEEKPTSVTFLMVDRPFIMEEMEEEKEIPIILGHSFLHIEKP